MEWSIVFGLLVGAIIGVLAARHMANRGTGGRDGTGSDAGDGNGQNMQ